MEMIVGASVLIILLVLVAKRIDAKGKETFEDRDN